jgi:hypothetical protein
MPEGMQSLRVRREPVEALQKWKTQSNGSPGKIGPKVKKCTMEHRDEGMEDSRKL